MFKQRLRIQMTPQPPFTAPAYRESGFNCPNCGAFANQGWSRIGVLDLPVPPIVGWELALCARCKQFSMWVGEVMVFPLSSTAPLPNPDLPDDIMADYDEARSILDRSPRGAAALLRLAIQKLCKHLGEKGKNIDEDIASLVSKGLSTGVKQMLDTVRVIGNEAVHPGTIDLRDDPTLARALFKLVNMIVEKTISEPKEIESIHSQLPPAKLKGIKDRDAKALPPRS